MSEIVALAMKDLRLLVRDKGALFFALGFPLLMAVFFGTILGGGGGGAEGPSGVAVGVVDLDRSAASAAFVEEMEAGEEFDVSGFETREAAVDAVRRGERSAAVVLGEGFGASRETVFWGEPARIEVVYDPSRGAEAAMIEGLLTRQAFEGLSETFNDSDTMLRSTGAALEAVRGDESMGPLAKGSLTQLLRSVESFYAVNQESWMTDGDEGEGAVGQVQWQPVEIETVSVREAGGAAEAESAGPGSGYDVTFPQGIVWGLIGVSAGFGISLVSERTGGTLRRLRVAPISRSDVLLGKGLACFTAIIAVSALLVLIGALVFGMRAGSWPLLAAGIASGGVCFTGIMMLLSVLGRSEQSAAGIGWAALLVLGMFGGAMVPLFIMPEWMQSMASFSPVKWAILAIEGPLWRGFGAEEMLLPCGILLVVGAAAFAVGAGVFGRLEEG